MAEKSSELNENTREEQANNESLALTGTGGLSTTDNYQESATNEDDFDEIDAEEEGATEETEEIRAQIEDTRQQMSETIDAIQEKLSFSNISEQVKDEVTEKISDALTTVKKNVYDAAIRRVGDVMGFVNKGFNEVSDTKIVSAARENPLAVTLIGLGIGILLVNSYRGGGGRSRSSYKGNQRKLISGGSERNQSSILKTAQNKISGAASGAYETVSGAAGTAYEGVGSAASGAYGSVSNAASSAYEGVTNAASQAYGKVGEYGSQAREQYDYYIEENPLAVGAVALALGAAVGLSIPSTSYESQLMGEHRDNLLQKAQESAGDLVDKVKQVASEAQKTIGEEVKSAAGEVKKTISDQAQAQGLTDAASATGGKEKTSSPGLSPKI
jgi:phage-related protein